MLGAELSPGNFLLADPGHENIAGIARNNRLDRAQRLIFGQTLLSEVKYSENSGGVAQQLVTLRLILVSHRYLGSYTDRSFAS